MTGSRLRYLSTRLTALALLGIVLIFVSAELRRIPLYRLPACHGISPDWRSNSVILTTLPQGLDIQRGWNGAYTLVALDEHGNHLCRFTDTPSFENAPVALSPDASQIVFEANIKSFSTQLWLADVAGSRLRVLVDNLPDGARYPIWSPDGQYIAFRDGNIAHQVYVVAVDGSRLNEIVLDGTALSGFSWAAWSPDSQRLAIAVRDGPGRMGNPGIYLMDRDARTLRRLMQAQPDALHGEPRWSDSGDAIHFLAGLRSDDRHSDLDQQGCTYWLASQTVDCRQGE